MIKSEMNNKVYLINKIFLKNFKMLKFLNKKY